mgnify:FL=1
MKIFPYHASLRKRNIAKFKDKIDALYSRYLEGITDYDKVYDLVEGWIAYAKQADTYNLRRKILAQLESGFSHQLSSKEVNRHLKHILANTRYAS